jgi:hypothetical protein
MCETREEDIGSRYSVLSSRERLTTFRAELLHSIELVKNSADFLSRLDAMKTQSISGLHKAWVRAIDRVTALLSFHHLLEMDDEALQRCSDDFLDAWLMSVCYDLISPVNTVRAFSALLHDATVVSVSDEYSCEISRAREASEQTLKLVGVLARSLPKNVA